MAKIYLNELEEKDLYGNVRNIVKEEFEAYYRSIISEKLLSPSEVCKLFDPNISKVTLANWTTQGRLKKYSLGGRVFYKYSEVMESLKTIKKYSSIN